MFGEWYKPGCMLEYPRGGTGAIIDALVRGLKKHKGRLSLNSHVETILIEGGRAVGVKLRNGQVGALQTSPWSRAKVIAISLPSIVELLVLRRCRLYELAKQ